MKTAKVLPWNTCDCFIAYFQGYSIDQESFDTKCFQFIKLRNFSLCKLFTTIVYHHDLDNIHDASYHHTLKKVENYKQDPCVCKSVNT